MKKEERKITIELLEAEQTNTYKILAEFFARKFNEKWFDNKEQKWLNKFVTNQGTAVLYKPTSVNRKKKGHTIKVCPFFIFIFYINL